MLTRDQILQSEDIETEEVYVRQWGGTVLVRSMSGTERGLFEKAQSVDVPSGNRNSRRRGQTNKEFVGDQLRAYLVVFCVVDEEGNHLFTEQDIPAINEKSAGAIELIVEAAMRLSGLTEEEVDKIAEEMIERPFSGSPSA